ncbi:Kinetochore protein Spc24 [Neocucurbitaria cava]|uniref:Kinetochore protein Spc24 n=1 Tax=Neocucurbitaria cava TaxID=798079 RepID=A0A9W8Y7P5_9PLEO|nr:Kinetochore protein Spc24 [Neocucurbitaria cava]
MAATTGKRHTNGAKRALNGDASASASASASTGGAQRPTKKARLLDNTDDEDSDAAADNGGVSLKVNEDYARRFEYNKKREEQHRLEAKYGKGKALQTADDDSDDSEEGVEEDDAAELLDEDLDDQVNATLQALRSKDPRIYNKDATFYRELDAEGPDANGPAKEQSLTLKQYHTKNLLEGKLTGEDNEDAPPRTYAQEQEETRQNLVKEMHAAADDDDDDDFLVAKEKPLASNKAKVKITVEDVEKADGDPETFLSNFMASRAWLPAGPAQFQPLNSDDDEEDAAAEEWEHSYNLYFEDTAGANEKIMTYARDAVASTTVRRDDATGRRKAREMARAKREAERREKEQDLARLRKLKVEEMEQKVNQIRKIGGLSGREFNMEEWKDVLEADWSDDQWDAEMQKRFGDAYYGAGGAGLDSDDEVQSKRKEPKKPKFDDDIDIKDLVPDFTDDAEEKPAFTLSSDEEDADVVDAEDDDEIEAKAAKSSKKRKQERADAKSAARRDRRLIENLVNDNLEYEAALASRPKAPTRFRYRETSPTTFGLTPRDILLADDKQLNEFAGLKKLAAFRDPVKKKKDKKHLSKKARLRQWRQETFGDAEGPKGGFETILGDGPGNVSKEETGNVIEGDGKKKKKKRSRKRKAGVAEA